ncbi:hypothetical protein GIB67_025757 [Kingdonia uniflora]|uniref:Rad21/Rec8-like protein C-terminal eukaryotic domain-containing protein n=1 Tax=Kingdonia uniflora TaxID=39325 RepID=A0A7J7L2V4_9MAGN|nr:hypothetical protein GIB67_025757 [Kingdonia uniflora]
MLTALLLKMACLPMYGQNITEYTELVTWLLRKRVPDSNNSKQQEMELVSRCLTPDVTREFHVGSLPYKPYFKVMPEGWDGTTKDPDKVHYEISVREDEMLYQDFVRRMTFSKKQEDLDYNYLFELKQMKGFVYNKISLFWSALLSIKQFLIEQYRIGIDEWMRVPSVEDVFALGGLCGFSREDRETIQENPEPQSNQHSDDIQEGPQHIKPMSNMKITHLMELPPVGLTCGLSGYGSKEIYYPAPLMNLWMKYSQLQPPHDSPLARLTSPPRPSSSSTPPPRPVFDQELPNFPADEFYIGVGSQPKPISIEKQVTMKKHMANPDNFKFPVTEATMMVTPGNSGTFGGNKRSIPSSGFGNGFFPVELENYSSNSKRPFSSSIQSGNGLAPVAEEIPWDFPEPSFKLRRLSESNPTHDPGPTQTQHLLVDLPMDKVTDAIRMHLKSHFDTPGAPQIESLGQLAFGLTRIKATQLFYQTCVLATHDLVKVQQRVAYEDILISRGPKM